MGRLKSNEKAEFWRRELARIESHPGPVSEYLRRHGISPSVYGYWRRQLSSRTRALTPSSGRSPQSAFAEVVVEAPEPRLPDPRWLADLILHLHGGSR